MSTNDGSYIDSANEYEKLLKNYIEIFNRAVAENKDRPPYKDMLSNALSQYHRSQDMHYVVYDMRPKASFKLRMTNGRLVIVNKDEQPLNDSLCSFSYNYLKKVTENADDYIKNPELLDWGWLSKSNS